MYALTGKECNKEFFHFSEDHAMDLNKVLKVLQGELAGSIFRGAIPSHICEKVEENFWKSPFIKERLDKVPAVYIGTYHYGKDLDTYFEEANQYREKLDALFEGTQHFFNNFIMNLTKYLEENGIRFRLAEHLGRQASSFRMASFPRIEPYAVKPHDDFAQCKAPIQKGFEIQNVKDFEIITVNICLANDAAKHEPEISGKFNYWNIQPNDSDRKHFNIEATGYPYPVELLHRFDRIEFPVYKGDLFLLNGRNIHGVGPFLGKSNRVTMQFFMGFINNNTVVYWV